jgi:hypothetical protein
MCVQALDEWGYRMKSLARYRRDIQQRFDRSVERFQAKYDRAANDLRNDAQQQLQR